MTKAHSDSKTETAMRQGAANLFIFWIFIFFSSRDCMDCSLPVLGLFEIRGSGDRLKRDAQRTIPTLFLFGIEIPPAPGASSLQLTTTVRCRGY